MAKGLSVRLNLRFREVPENVTDEVGEAIRNIALDLLGESVIRAPVEEGTLRGSGTAHFGGKRIASGKDFDPTATGNAGKRGGQGSGPLSAIVAFNVPYAAVQHERTDFAHPKGGQARYLVQPLEQNRSQYEKRIAAAVKRGTS